MKRAVIGFAMTGSFCTFEPAIHALENLAAQCGAVIPIMSENAYFIDSRFGESELFIRRIERICGHPVCRSIPEVEPFGPGKTLDALIVAPCTGNTLAKLSAGIADSCVTFACKAHLRNSRPVVLAISTNDALAASAENIGKLLVRKNYYFVPFGQDDWQNKPCSMVAHMEQLPETVAAALRGEQLQPLLRNY